MTSQEIVRESQRRRFARVEDVDDVIALDPVWRDKRWELDGVNAEFNKANKAVSKLKVAKEDATAAIAEVQAIKERMTALAEEEKAAEEAVNKLLVKIGNLVHDSVPVVTTRRTTSSTTASASTPSAWRITSPTTSISSLCSISPTPSAARTWPAAAAISSRARACS